MLQMLNHTIFLLLAVTTLAHSQISCSVADEQLLKQRRVQAIRTNILAQLGLTEPPPKRAKPTIVAPEIIENFRTVSHMTSLMEQERDKVCQSKELLAQPIISFIGTMNSDTSEKLETRSVGTNGQFAVQDPPNLLNRYSLLIDFNLNKNHSFVTQASLILFQLPASKLDSSIHDSEQYVEVKSIDSSSGYYTSSLIVGKHFGIFDAGFQVLDITPTVQMWASSGVSGEIHLSVSIYCLSSPDCAKPDSEGEKPKSVEFFHAQSSPDKAPRLVMTTKNPLEVQDSPAKRQTSSNDPPKGASFCVNNQSTCCLKELFINFEEDLPDFDFIVDPPSFQANYCEGICPLVPDGELMTPLLFNFLSRLQDHPASSITPCCSGTAYKSLNILVNMGGSNATSLNLEEHKLENVVVTGCKCG